MGDDALYYGTWDDVAGQQGLMFSPALFRRYFLPLYRRLIEQNKKRGLCFGWHVCGSVHKVLPMMIDAGIDVFDVVQTSARDMEIENVYRLYGKDVCLHGGLDVQKLLVDKTDDGYTVYKRYGREGLMLYELIGKELTIKEMADKVTTDKAKVIDMFLFIHEVLGIELPIDRSVLERQLGL